MRRLGVSIYPNKSSLEEDIRYLSLAAKYGFKSIFTNLISIDENSLAKFKEIINYGRSLGMEVIADVSPEVFKSLGIHYSDLKFFKDMNLTGIRLDLGFTGNEESIMSFNPYGIKIEINMSSNIKHLENIMAYVPNKDNIIGCHNFYPHRYTGLSRKHFIKTSRSLKIWTKNCSFYFFTQCNFWWPINEGLPTLEEHRNLP